MGKNQSQSSPCLDELAVKAKEAAIRAEDKSNLLSFEAKQEALLEKRDALTQLVSLLGERIKVEMPKPRNASKSEYIYEEFIQELWLFICKNIARYDPDKGSFMSWVRNKSKYINIDAYHWINWNKRNSDMKVISTTDNNESGSNILDRYDPDEINPFLKISEEWIEYKHFLAFIKKDPEGQFASKIFKNKVSYQTIVLKKCEEGKTWKEIYQELELGNTHGSIYSFYIRASEEFLPYFKKYLSE
ncbi:hypothetical protein [Calothrix sp. CCY 0018]|uniref:hypothetical protein n=1 Tax=Calothrix sp. CCY 0018 TaxID=3103864 RepID=UPI0039C6617A